MNIRVLVDIGHPAHVHLFKHIIWGIEELGGHVCITTRKKDVATALLDACGFEYQVIGHYPTSIGKVLSFLTTNRKLLKIAHSFNPHLFISVGSIHAAQVAWILNRIYVSFEDTENNKFQQTLYKHFATRIYTPSAFRLHLGRNQVFYEGYHELSYLSPKYFTPNPAVLPHYGLSPDDPFFIMRLVSWSATHDRGQKGMIDIDRIIKHLEQFGRVFVSAETEAKLKRIEKSAEISPKDMHDMLSFASLYIGEGATMASESATLGTPAIYVNSQRCGTLDAEKQAGLLYHVVPSKDAINKVSRIIDEVMERPPQYFKKKSLEFIDGKIDVVDTIIKELLDLTRKRY